MRNRFSGAKVREYRIALLRCLESGWRVLDAGGGAVDAVAAAVKALEDCPLFNAGKGAVLNAEGRAECDAAVMDGLRGTAGAVAGVTGVRNPVALARAVMENGQTVFLVGDGARRFAESEGLELVDESYFVTSARKKEWIAASAAGRVELDHAKFGTVGAVARDRAGNLAAATSTGGLTNKAPGRVGDSPVIGAGTYADNGTCAVSCTGVGEVFIVHVVSHEISARMRYLRQPLSQAAFEMIQHVLAPQGGVGGLIAVDAAGDVCIEFNSPSMFRAWRRGTENPSAEIF